MQIKNKFISRFFETIFNRDKYRKNKILSQNESNKILFKKKYENYINSIQKILTTKKEI